MGRLSRCSRNSIKRINLGNMEISYDVERRNVVYPRLEFKKDKVLVILPKNVKDEKEILTKKSDWLIKKQKNINDAVKKLGKKHKQEQLLFGRISRKENSESELRDMLKERIHDFADEYSKSLNVNINKIFIRKQKTKWASCSSKGNLSFNLKLAHLPENLIKYVVYHEIVHIKERKHNRIFWRYLMKKFPEYKEMETSLLGFWFYLDNYN